MTEPEHNSKKRQLVIMAGLMLALAAAMAIGSRGGGGGRRGGFVRSDEGGATPGPTGESERPERVAPPEPIDKAAGGARGTRGGEQSVEGSRQDPQTEADRDEAAARSAHEEKIERTRQAIDEARRQGRSADAERLQQRLDDLEARRPKEGD